VTSALPSIPSVSWRMRSLLPAAYLGRTHAQTLTQPEPTRAARAGPDAGGSRPGAPSLLEVVFRLRHRSGERLVRGLRCGIGPETRTASRQVVLDPLGVELDQAASEILTRHPPSREQRRAQLVSLERALYRIARTGGGRGGWRGRRVRRRLAEKPPRGEHRRGEHRRPADDQRYRAEPAAARVRRLVLLQLEERGRKHLARWLHGPGGVRPRAVRRGPRLKVSVSGQRTWLSSPPTTLAPGTETLKCPLRGLKRAGARSLRPPVPRPPGSRRDG